MWYLVSSWKLLSDNPQAPLKKSTPPFLLTPPSKNSKIASPPLFANIENFLGPSTLQQEGAGEDTVWNW